MRWRFVARRLVMLLVTLRAASFVIFAAVYLAPGSPLAALSGGPPLSPSSVTVRAGYRTRVTAITVSSDPIGTSTPLGLTISAP
jgi:ABC-type dipeptide/oligopeptide/nickel transport system permease component